MQEQSCKEDAPHTSRDAHRGQYVELCAGAKNAQKLKRRKADTDVLAAAACIYLQPSHPGWLNFLAEMVLMIYV